MRRVTPKLPIYQITQLPNSPAPRVPWQPPAFEIIQYYRILHSSWGPQNWWPAESRLEVIVGAYLTQNTNWGNVEKAMANLRRARALGLDAMRELRLRKLEALV